MIDSCERDRRVALVNDRFEAHSSTVKADDGSHRAGS